MSEPRSGRKTSGALVLAILVVVYVLNLVDRLILSILAGPIKSEFLLTDTQLGLLGGLAFALFYASFGIPIAWLADRRSRVKIIAWSVAIWSGFTALCGVSQNYGMLLLARMGVGIGEAGGIAPSYSLIADYFPPERRARALAIFSFGSPIGSALGILFGGWIATHLDWRAAFLIVGLAGLPVAALVAFGIVEPARGRLDGLAAAAGNPPPSLRKAAATLGRNRSFWLISLGGAFSNIPIYGLLFWLPSYFQRSLGLTLADAAWYYGTIVLVGGIVGMWTGGWMGDRLGGRGPRVYMVIPAISFLVSAPAYALALFAPNLTLGWVLFVVPQALAFLYVGPMLTSVQHIVPPEMRATASASFLFIANLIGTGFGTLFLGMMSDAMSAGMGADGLRYAILLGLAFYPLAALMFLLATRVIAGDWRQAAR